MRIQAVILDLDGLMVDSEPLSYRAWNAVLAEHGAALDDEVYRTQVIGLHDLDSGRLVRKLTGVEADERALVDAHWERLVNMLPAELEPMPGLHALLQALQARGLPLGLASNSRSPYVQRALEVLGLLECFRCIRTVDDVQHGKPAPDVYLAVARGLQARPERCLALEDSATGVQAALAAGMRTVVVDPQGLVPASLEGTHGRFASLEEVHAALDRLLG